MIERGMIGGTCINVDCIPTKTLVASAGVAELVSGAGQFGIRVDGWKSDLASVLANKRAVVSGLPMVELGRVFRRLGSRVTIVQRRPHLLPAEDADVSEAIESIFREDGIDVVLSAKVTAVGGRSGDSVHLRCGRREARAPSRAADS